MDLTFIGILSEKNNPHICGLKRIYEEWKEGKFMSNETKQTFYNVSLTKSAKTFVELEELRAKVEKYEKRFGGNFKPIIASIENEQNSLLQLMMPMTRKYNTLPAQ